MPFVTIKMIAGRTVEQKRNMVRDVTNAIAKTADCPLEAIHIDIIEYSQENIGHGGKLFADNL